MATEMCKKTVVRKNVDPKQLLNAKKDRFKDCFSDEIWVNYLQNDQFH